MKKTNGFTLIELLIVVAIIAILAAIAVPNFLEALVRAKVSRCKADMRTYATALEAYAVDANEYPNWLRLETGSFGIVPLEETLIPLSTPVAYLSDALLLEPFNSKQGAALFRGCDVVAAGGHPPADRDKRQPIYGYISLPNSATMTSFRPILMALFRAFGLGITNGQFDTVMVKQWFIFGPGPDTYYSFDRCIGSGLDSLTCVFAEVSDVVVTDRNGIYDPTNGTTSRGELVRTRVGIQGEAR